jgi:hypothetical protein
MACVTQLLHMFDHTRKHSNSNWLLLVIVRVLVIFVLLLILLGTVMSADEQSVY